MKKGKIIEIIWLVVVVALFVVSIKMIRSGALQESIASFGIFAPLIIILLKASTLVIAPLGGTPLYVIAGALFGVFKGFFISFAGDVLGSISCFYISKKWGSKIVRYLAGENFFIQIQKIVGLLQNTKSFIKARLAFFTIPELFAYSAGLSNVSFLKFIFIHSLFMLPISVVGVFFGASLVDFVSDHPWFAILVPLAIGLFGVFMFWKDYQKAEGM